MQGAGAVLSGMYNRYLYAFRFFTTWMIVLVVFHHTTHRYINLLLLATVTAVVGLYLSFVNPRRFVFYFEGERHEYTGLQKFIIVDIMFHVLMLYFVWSRYGRHYMRCGIGELDVVALALLVGYVLTHDVRKVYGIHVVEMLAVGVVGVCLYYLLAGKKCQ